MYFGSDVSNLILVSRPHGDYFVVLSVVCTVVCALWCKIIIIIKIDQMNLINDDDA